MTASTPIIWLPIPLVAPPPTPEAFDAKLQALVDLMREKTA